MFFVNEIESRDNYPKWFSAHAFHFHQISQSDHSCASFKMLKPTVQYIAEETSVHGLKFLANPKVNKVLRVFWCFILIGSISGLLLYARILYIKLNVEPEINVRIKLRPMSEIPFPAVTICDPIFAKNNMTNYLQYIYNHRKNIVQNLSATEQNHMAASLHMCAPSSSWQSSWPADMFKDRTEFDTVKLLNESAFLTDEIFILCFFRRVRSSHCENILNRILTDQGFCFSANMQGYFTIFNRNVVSKDFDSYKRKTINSRWLSNEEEFAVNDDNETIHWTLDDGYSFTGDDAAIIPKRASKQNFLHFYAFISKSDARNYCPQFGQVHNVIFHMPNEIPTIFHQEYSIGISHQKTMFLTAESFRSDDSLRRFTPKQRQCYFENERQLKFFKSYTKSHCDLECVTNYTLALCGCVKFSMPRAADTPVCDDNQRKCYYDKMLTWPNNRSHYGSTDSACDCYPTCNGIKYGVSYENSAEFMNYNSLAHLKNVDE
jgi:amiloride-sensitive sodium channel